mgnify:FL=1
MAKIFKPLYQCEGCGETFEDPDQVRIFAGEVTNGTELKSFIRPTQMYCLNCLKHSLDYDNNNPETVIIKESKEEIVDIPFQEQVMNRLNLFDEFRQETLVNLELIAKNIEKHVNIEKLLKEKFFDLKEQFEKNQDNIVKNQEEFLEEGGTKLFDQINHPEESIISQEEPEITKEENYSETLHDIADTLTELPDSGKYLILIKINNKNDETIYANKCNIDVKMLRENCGKQPLIGLYYSSDKYCESVGDIGNNYKSINTKIINKMFFGVPNIIEKQIWDFQSLGIALIEKTLFEDKIEPIKYEIPEENDSKTIGFPEGAEIEIVDKTIKETYSDPGINESKNETRKTITTTIQPKKKFFGRDLRDKDDYI